MSGQSGFEQLSGDQWQELCLRVLHEHHPGADFVEVPDDDRGDAGLEGFSLSGSAYQCYAPEGEPLSTDQRYQRQRRKMTADVGKFIANAAKIEPLIPSGMQISRWVLLVPRITTRKLVAHAKTQTDRVRAAALPYAAPDIVVVPLTLDAFEAARIAVVTRQLTKLHLPPLEGPDFSEIDDGLIAVMDAKLALTARYSDGDHRSTMINRLLANFVGGQAHRSHISDHYSELGDRLDEELMDLEERLVMQYALNEPVPDRRLSKVLEDTEAVVGDVLNTRAAQSRMIAEGQVADWLMRCPLDFA